MRQIHGIGIPTVFAVMFTMAADGGFWLAGGHLAFPGIGHIRAAAGRYFFIPATYRLPQ